MDVDVTVREVPLSRLRKAVAKTMATSAAMPQFTVGRDIQPDQLLALRLEMPREVSTLDMLHAAVARAVAAHPRLNASWQDSVVHEFDRVNLGIAVAVPDGILVPAIEDADRRSLVELSATRRELTAAARENRLTPAQVGAATFTVTNLAPVGATWISPLVIPPQAAILGLPAPRRGGEISVSLTCDHRVVDGLPAAEFLRDLATAIEEPSWLLDVVGDDQPSDAGTAHVRFTQGETDA